MDFYTATLFVIIGYAFYYYFKKTLDYFEERGIPYMPGWPILGNFASTAFRKEHFSHTLHRLYNFNQDAKYVGVFDFIRPVIMLRDPELIKSVTIKHFDNFPDHKTFVDEKLDPLFAGNLFGMTGERWKEARNLLSPAFTSSKMKAMFQLMVDCGKNFVKYLEERPKEDNKMIPTKDLFTKFTNDVIATCAFGISVDSLKDPNNEFYVLGKEATNFEKMTIKFFLARISSKLVKLLNLRFVSERVGVFFKEIVSTTVATRDEKGISRPDMIQLMMDARKKDNKYLKLDITEMTAQAFIFFFGGFDTTSTQMCLVAHELAINPDIQRRLQDEIDEVMKESNGKPTYEHIHGMAYMDAVFNETMRLHTQVSFVDRLCVKAFELPPALPGGKPYTIQPGMNIWIPGSAMHRDPKYYENPNEFNPNRYYHKKITINDVHNLSFGIGPRSCIGNRFATLEIKILFFFLLSKFNLKPTAKTCNPLTYSTKSFALTAEGGYWVSIESRET